MARFGESTSLLWTVAWLVLLVACGSEADGGALVREVPAASEEADVVATPTEAVAEPIEITAEPTDVAAETLDMVEVGPAEFNEAGDRLIGTTVELGATARFGDFAEVVVRDVRWVTGPEEADWIGTGYVEGDDVIEVDLIVRSTIELLSAGPDIYVDCVDDGRFRSTLAGGPVFYAELAPLASVEGIEVLPVPGDCAAPVLHVRVLGVTSPDSIADYALPPR